MLDSGPAGRVSCGFRSVHKQGGKLEKRHREGIAPTDLGESAGIIRIQLNSAPCKSNSSDFFEALPLRTNEPDRISPLMILDYDGRALTTRSLLRSAPSVRRVEHPRLDESKFHRRVEGAARNRVQTFRYFVSGFKSSLRGALYISHSLSLNESKKKKLHGKQSRSGIRFSRWNLLFLVFFFWSSA